MSRGRTILKWVLRIFVGLLVLIVLVLAAGAAFELYAQHDAKRRYPPPGRMVDVGGGRRMHIDCRGMGSPTVILQSGLDSTGSLGWGLVHDKLASLTRTCAYDRAGIMWSDPSSNASDDPAINADLHTLLKNAGETGPFVLVGHSLGGPLILDFTHRYGADVAGLVFVDASHPDQIARFKAVGFPANPSLGPLKALVALRWTGWTRWPTKSEGVDHFPKASLGAAHAYAGKSMAGAMGELSNLAAIFSVAGADRGQDPHPLGDRPVVVLTGLKPMPPQTLKAMGVSPAVNAARVKTWVDMHDEEASWSTRSRHVRVPDASHYIQLDRPDVVIEAVTSVVEAVRASSAPHPPSP